MKIVKKTIVLYIDVPPIEHESHQVYPHVTVFSGSTPMEGSTRKTLAITLDVPVRYEELSADSVKEITSNTESRQPGPR